jgi:hypothetical protein
MLGLVTAREIDRSLPRRVQSNVHMRCNQERIGVDAEDFAAGRLT